MGLHSSLKRAEKLGGSRSVMKRTERIKWLKEKGKWDENDTVLGLPKIKIVKLKAIKKEKAKETEEDTAKTKEEVKDKKQSSDTAKKKSANKK